MATSQLSRRRSTFLLQMAQVADFERGDRIRQLREPVPQQVIADAVGVTLRAYQEWEAGGGIRYENVKALARHFGVEESFILKGTPETPDVIGSLNGNADLAQIDKRLAHIEAAVQELVSWSQAGPTRKNLVERIEALTELIAPVVGAQESRLSQEPAESSQRAARRSSRVASGR